MDHQATIEHRCPWCLHLFVVKAPSLQDAADHLALKVWMHRLGHMPEPA